MQSLRFNICGLESSYLRNHEVADLQARIESIPEQMRYACCFWSHHICGAPMSDSLLHALQVILEERILYWLEVLSVLQKVNIASMHLRELQHWAQVVYSVNLHHFNINIFPNLGSQCSYSQDPYRFTTLCEDGCSTYPPQCSTHLSLCLAICTKVIKDTPVLSEAFPTDTEVS